MPTFKYIESSDRRDFIETRQIIEGWFGRYPTKHQENLRNRIRSEKDESCIEAFFELAVHELVIASGWRVDDVEPSIPGTERKPDFLISGEKCPGAYLEVTVANCRTRQQIGRDRLKAALEARIASVTSNHYFVSVRFNGQVTSLEGMRYLKKKLQVWLSALDYKEQCKKRDSNSRTSSTRIETPGFSLSFTVMPRNKPGKSLSILGIMSGGIINQSSAVGARDAVKGKAGRYGEVDRPYLIAVNVRDFTFNRSDAMDTLFGAPEVIFRRKENGDLAFVREERNREGAFISRGGAQNTRVSGVMFASNMLPWNAMEKRWTYFPHPWTKKAVDLTSWQLSHASYADDRTVQFSDGAPFGEILTPS